MNKLKWEDSPSGYSIWANTEKGRYSISYEDGLWGYSFTKYGEEFSGLLGVGTFGHAKEICENHYIEDLALTKNIERA